MVSLVNTFGKFFVLSGAALAFSVAPGVVHAESDRVLYSFCAAANPECADGATPSSGVIRDTSGNLYGTTNLGGTGGAGGYCSLGCGTVYKLGADGSETVLYSFCTESETCPDGGRPYGGVIRDKKGNLYGTTAIGGANRAYGIVFKVTPKGNETVLYSFCSRTNCTDGGNPEGDLIMDSSGNLYGTTICGGESSASDLCGGNSGSGTVFKLARTIDGQTEWTETVLYSFCSKADCTDGQYPETNLIVDSSGDLYGTTFYGGNIRPENCSPYGCGVVFKVTPKGKETVLYSFCSQANCTDGAYPSAGLIEDSSGNLYGTTSYGGNMGANCVSSLGCGVVFKVTPERKETVLYSFCSAASCADGGTPGGGVIMDSSGNLYGTTKYGRNNCGPYSCGTVFRLAPDGDESVLYAFQGLPSDGANPAAGLILDEDSFYGTTTQGGANHYCDSLGCGTVFTLKN